MNEFHFERNERRDGGGGGEKPVNENLLHDNVAIVNVIYNDANIHKSLWQSGASNLRIRWRARCSAAKQKVVFGVEYMTA